MPSEDSQAVFESPFSQNCPNSVYTLSSSWPSVPDTQYTTSDKFITPFLKMQNHVIDYGIPVVQDVILVACDCDAVKAVIIMAKILAWF